MGNLLNDTRAVRCISWAGGIEGPGYHRVGLHGCSSIEVVGVAGNGAMVPWFVVVLDHEDGEPIVQKFNAAFLDCVEYAIGRSD